MREGTFVSQKGGEEVVVEAVGVAVAADVGVDGGEGEGAETGIACFSCCGCCRSLDFCPSVEIALIVACAVVAVVVSVVVVVVSVVAVVDVSAVDSVVVCSLVVVGVVVDVIVGDGRTGSVTVRTRLDLSNLAVAPCSSTGYVNGICKKKLVKKN